jgi:hypothetical protein
MQPQQVLPQLVQRPVPGHTAAAQQQQQQQQQNSSSREQ